MVVVGLFVDAGQPRVQLVNELVSRVSTRTARLINHVVNHVSSGSTTCPGGQRSGARPVRDVVPDLRWTGHTAASRRCGHPADVGSSPAGFGAARPEAALYGRSTAEFDCSRCCRGRTSAAVRRTASRDGRRPPGGAAGRVVGWQIAGRGPEGDGETDAEERKRDETMRSAVWTR